MVTTRRLHRSRTQRMLGGVAGGLAEYFDVDPTIVRLGLIAALIFGHVITFVLYIAAWLLMPVEPRYD
jgi:phage shock protein C